MWNCVVRNPGCCEKPKFNDLELRLVVGLCALLGHVQEGNVLRSHHTDRQPQMSLSPLNALEINFSNCYISEWVRNHVSYLCFKTINSLFFF
jgi:hypothetical protein